MGLNMATRKIQPKPFSFKQASAVVVIGLLFISLPLALWGFAFEFSYFSVLGLNATQYLSYEHYAVSLRLYLIGMLIVLILITSLGKFFGKDIQKDDWSDLTIAWNAMPFDNHMKLARYICGFIMVFWLIVVFEPYTFYGYTISLLGTQFLLLFYFATTFFASAIYVSNLNGRLWFSVIYLIVASACFSMAGMELGREEKNFALTNASENKSVLIRNDRYIKVRYENGKYLVEVYPIIDITSLLDKYFMSRKG